MTARGPYPRFWPLSTRAGVRVGSVTVARPSLDDVYLRHVGRRFTTATNEEA